MRILVLGFIAGIACASPEEPDGIRVAPEHSLDTLLGPVPAPPIDVMPDTVPDVLSSVTTKEKRHVRTPVRSRNVPGRMVGWSGADPKNAEGRYDVDLPPAVLASHPDTLRALARDFYRMQEPSFPVSIADDLERGISTEHIHYPRIHLALGLFAGSEAEVPYRVERLWVWMEGNEVRVE